MQLEAGALQLQAVVADNTRLEHKVSRLQEVQALPFLIALSWHLLCPMCPHCFITYSQVL